MNHAFSPGPWTKRTFDECQTVILSGTQLVAVISVGEGRPHGEGNVEAMVRLPEMVAQIEAAVKAFEYLDRVDPLMSGWGVRAELADQMRTTLHQIGGR